MSMEVNTWGGKREGAGPKKRGRKPGVKYPKPYNPYRRVAEKYEGHKKLEQEDGVHFKVHARENWLI